MTTAKARQSCVRVRISTGRIDQKKHSSVKTDDGEVITARQIKKPQKKNAALDLKKLFYIHATLKKG